MDIKKDVVLLGKVRPIATLVLTQPLFHIWCIRTTWRRHVFHLFIPQSRSNVLPNRVMWFMIYPSSSRFNCWSARRFSGNVVGKKYYVCYHLSPRPLSGFQTFSFIKHKINKHDMKPHHYFPRPVGCVLSKYLKGRTTLEVLPRQIARYAAWEEAAVGALSHADELVCPLGCK